MTENLLLVNRTHLLPPEYIHSIELVKTMTVEGGECLLEKRTFAAYEVLRRALAACGVIIGLDSGYRSVARQKAILEDFTQRFGETYAQSTVAPPGSSEHHTGLALDIVPQVDGKWITDNEEMLQQTELFAAIHALLPQHGFILRYPKGKEAVTGYSYEPWHLRYVGPTAALEIFRRQQTLEEYLET